MKKHYSAWERIEEIIKHYGFASVSAFARELGYRVSEKLYQVRRGDCGISNELADVITERLPEVSKAWLLTGGGEMLRERKTTDKLPDQVVINIYLSRN